MTLIITVIGTIICTIVFVNIFMISRDISYLKTKLNIVKNTVNISPNNDLNDDKRLNEHKFLIKELNLQITKLHSTVQSAVNLIDALHLSLLQNEEKLTTFLHDFNNWNKTLQILNVKQIIYFICWIGCSDYYNPECEAGGPSVHINAVNYGPKNCQLCIDKCSANYGQRTIENAKIFCDLNGCNNNCYKSYTNRFGFFNSIAARPCFDQCQTKYNTCVQEFTTRHD